MSASQLIVILYVRENIQCSMLTPLVSLSQTGGFLVYTYAAWFYGVVNYLSPLAILGTPHWCVLVSRLWLTSSERQIMYRGLQVCPHLELSMYFNMNYDSLRFFQA